MNLLIMGAPGSGKGTMSNFIINDYKVVHVSTGDMLREAINKKTPVGLKASEYMSKGNLVPDSIIHDLIVERLSKDDIKQGFLFDGYPRTLAQALDLDKILKEINLKIDAVINLNVDDEVLKKRITGRRTCPKCGEIYNIYFKPTQKENVCDKCGETLTTRSDDNLESLTIRLQEYHKNTEPIVAYYKKAGIAYDIDGEQGDSNKVYEDIKKLLEAFK